MFFSMILGAVLPALCAAVLGSSLVAATTTSTSTSVETPSTHSTTSPLTSTGTTSTYTTSSSTSAVTASTLTTPADCAHCANNSSCDTETNSTCLHLLCDPVTGSCYGDCEDGWYGDKCDRDCAHCANNSSCDTETNSTCLHLLCDPVTGSCYGDCEDGWYGDKCDRDQYNETASTTDSGSSLGSMKIAIITLSLLLAASVAVNVIIVVVKIKTKYRRPKGKAMFDLVHNQYSPGGHETIELKAHNAIQNLEYQPNTGQPQFQDDEYEDLTVGTQNYAYEIPVRNTFVQTDLAKTNTKTLTPPMPVPGPRADTRTSSRLSVESGQREGNAVQRVRSEETPVQSPLAEPPLPVRPERRSRNTHPELSESSAEFDVDGSENIVIARDSLALHARKIGLDIPNRRESGAYTLPDDGTNYSVSDIEEAVESEEDADDGLYENEVVTGDENKKPLDIDDDSDPYENEDFIDAQFRRLKYKYELGDGGRTDDDGVYDDGGYDPLNGSTSGVDGSEDDDEEQGDTFRKASMTVQYNSNDHLHDIEEEEEEVEEEEEAAEDAVVDVESRGRYTGDSNRESDYLNYRTVNGLFVSVDAIIDEGDDYDNENYDGDDRDLYENEMVSRRNIGGRDAGGVSTQRNLDGQEETFTADVSGGDDRDMGQRDDDGGFVVDSTQPLPGTGGEINDIVEDEKDDETDEDVVQDGNVNDVDQLETFQSTENGSERNRSRLDVPLESPPQQNEDTDGNHWRSLQKVIWPENESPQNGFADNEFTPDKHTHKSGLEDTPASHKRDVRWTIGDSESSGQTIGDEDLNEWSQALDSDFQQNPRGPVAMFDSDSDEYNV
ncbi:dentin matrix acidic phosphoprotein 1-like isoform X2 [Haliotis rubra]|uniref:dentin matrix acidic phosphoprotein 1-like isoform X2 n=1 Tax=Haliotis rubra TaxID=36100 RepID=UPI001EE53110|nr:dentin matrix acidic phosphoprotein 1-like isoform X2 [Haliotis rubra]